MAKLFINSILTPKPFIVDSSAGLYSVHLI